MALFISQFTGMSSQKSSKYIKMEVSQNRATPGLSIFLTIHLGVLPWKPYFTGVLWSSIQPSRTNSLVLASTFADAVRMCDAVGRSLWSVEKPREKTQQFMQESRTLGIWLVVWNMAFFFHILGKIIPTDFHIFRRGRYTTNQVYDDHESNTAKSAKPSICTYQKQSDFENPMLLAAKFIALKCKGGISHRIHVWYIC